MSMYGDVVDADGVVASIGNVGWRRGGRFRVAQVNAEPSRTKQEFAEEQDINNILGQYKRAGIDIHRMKFDANYEDVTGAVDYHEALNIVMRSEDMFMTLPSDVRDRFQNDPGKFLEFATNPANLPEMVKMGLAKEKVDEDREKVDALKARVNAGAGESDGAVAGSTKGSDASGSK